MGALYSTIAWFHGASGAWIAVIVLSITALGMFTGRFLFPTSIEGRRKYAFVVSHLLLAGICGWFLFQNLST